MIFETITPSGQPSPMPRSTSPRGVVRVWGLAQLAPVIGRMVDAGARAGALPADLTVELTMTGSDIAMAGLYTARADVALIGRGATEPEIKAFEWVYRYRPTAHAVMLGSVASPGRSPALAVLAHVDNPIQQITLAQLAATFGAARDGRPAATRWGDMGLSGSWRTRPISLYAPSADSGTGRFFRELVLGGSAKMAWDRLTEFTEPIGPVPSDQSAHAAVARAVAADSSALGIAALPRHQPMIRPIPVRPASGLPPVLPTTDTVSTGQYPLARTVFAYVNQSASRAPLDKVDVLLRVITGEIGRAVLADEPHGYLPLESSNRTVEPGAMRS